MGTSYNSFVPPKRRRAGAGPYDEVILKTKPILSARLARSVRPGPSRGRMPQRP